MVRDYNISEYLVAIITKLYYVLIDIFIPS